LTRFGKSNRIKGRNPIIMRLKSIAKAKKQETATYDYGYENKSYYLSERITQDALADYRNNFLRTGKLDSLTSGERLNFVYSLIEMHQIMHIGVLARSLAPSTIRTYD
jgi:hypothetical protein